MSEPTLPPDIAAAINKLVLWSHRVGETYRDSEVSEKHAARAALEAAILGHLPVWRPIETAPKDGKKVMLYRPLAGESNDPVISIRRTTKTSQHCWPDTIPPGCDGQNFTEGSCYATHWQPLPSPPSTDLGRAALAEAGRTKEG